MNKVVVFGSRDFCVDIEESKRCFGGKQYDHLKINKAFDLIQSLVGNENIEIVSGLASGADTVGYYYAIKHGLSLWQFPADWLTHGNRAGMIRNAEMRKIGNIFIGFWDGKSPGTREMYHSLLKEGKTVYMFDLDCQPIKG